MVISPKGYGLGLRIGSYVDLIGFSSSNTNRVTLRYDVLFVPSIKCRG